MLFMVTFSIETDGTPTITAEILDENDNTVKADTKYFKCDSI